MLRLIEIDPDSRGTEPYLIQLREWDTVLKNGGVVAFSTDTVWGVGARASDAQAVERLYELKGRHDSQPLACLVGNARIARRFASSWPEPVDRLANLHWPGPLTLVVPTNGTPLPAVQRGVCRLGLRVPDRPVLLDLLMLLDEPLAATSANRSGHPELSGVDQIRTAFGERLDLLVSDKLSVSGVASTVVEWNDGRLRILRQGSLGILLDSQDM